MAEMTAAAMVEWLTVDKAFGEECYSRKQIAALIEQQAATIEALEKTIVKRCQYHRKNDAHRCPYNSKGCMDWELCNKHFHDCGKEWQVKEGQG